MSLLSAQELHRLTGRVRYKAQAKALKRLGIRFTLSAKGEPLVRDGALDGPQPRERNVIRWDRVNA